MASVKYGALITELKGKIGGTVFQGGPAGSVAKNIDAIADSAKLTKADAGRAFPPRKIIAQVSGLWRLLSQLQRDAWNAAAPLWPATNRFGEVYTPSGFNVFMKLNAQMVNLTGVSLSDPPIGISIPLLDPITIAVPDDIEFNVDLPGGVPAGFYLRTEATMPMGIAINPKNSFFKIIAQTPSGVIFPQDMADGYKEVYGLWLNVCTIWTRFCLVSSTTGQKGIYQYYKTNVNF